jgi:DNA-binding transcriptional ArsR family regulator
MSECSDEVDAAAVSVAAPDQCDAVVVDVAAVARVTGAIPEERVVQRTADIFSALADPTRLRILQALVIEDLCVCDLASVAGVSQSAVSHQLRLLRDRDLVAFRREGKRAVYRLADDHVRVLLAQGIAHAQEGR